MDEKSLQEALLNEGKVKDALRKGLNATDADLEKSFVARATKKKAKLNKKGKKIDMQELHLDSDNGKVYFTYRLIDKSGSTGFLTRKIFIAYFADEKKADSFANKNEAKYISLFKKAPDKLTEKIEEKIDEIVDPVQEAIFTLFESSEEEVAEKEKDSKKDKNDEVEKLEETLDKEFGF